MSLTRSHSRKSTRGLLWVVSIPVDCATKERGLRSPLHPRNSLSWPTITRSLGPPQLKARGLLWSSRIQPATLIRWIHPVGVSVHSLVDHRAWRIPILHQILTPMPSRIRGNTFISATSTRPLTLIRTGMGLPTFLSFYWNPTRRRPLPSTIPLQDFMKAHTSP